MRIVITGIPASGKTAIATALAERLNYPLVTLTDFVKRKRLSRGYDKKRKAKIVDVEKLRKALNKEFGRKRNIIFEGHLLCEFPLKADYVIVIRCHPDVLYKRMKKRGYGKSKIDENILAELLDYCVVRAIQNYGKDKVKEIESSRRSLEENIELIIKILKGKRKRGDKVNWTAHLIERVINDMG